MANKIITVTEADGTTTDIEVLDVGRQPAVASKSVALETVDSGNLASLKTAAELIDNMIDTGSGRAGVNLIGTQVGIDGAAGAVTPKTPRMTLADDDVLVRAIQGVAHGAAAGSVNPSLLGLYALAHGANPSAVAAAQATKWYGNVHGIPWTIGGHPNVKTTEFVVLAADGAQTNLALISVAPGLKIVVTQAQISMSSANTTTVGVRLGFGLTTLPAAALAGAAGILLSGKFGASGGTSRGVGAGIIGIGADGEDLRLTCDSPVSGELRITVSHYTIEA